MDGWMDGWMGGWMGGGLMDGSLYESTHLVIRFITSA